MAGGAEIAVAGVMAKDSGSAVTVAGAGTRCHVVIFSAAGNQTVTGM
jgi:hypothetical protein